MNGGYEATPVERAYSLYLVHQVFGILLPLPNHNAVNIPGRNAVPFLTQSGVDRGILRSIWSVADPQNFGSLTNIVQFHVLLRLVAMAQAGIVWNASQPQEQQHAIQLSLQQCASRQLPLPVFSGVAIPQPDALMAMYGSYLVLPQQPTLPAGFSCEPKALQSVDDAFGGIVPVEDAPLPSLGAFAATVEPETTTTTAASSFEDEDDDDFGDFGSAPTPAPTLRTPSSIGGTPSMMTTSVEAEATTSAAAATASSFQDDDDDDDDDFGDFGSAPTQPTPDNPSTTMMMPDENTSNFQTNDPIFESSSPQLPSSSAATMPEPFVTDFDRVLSEPIATTTPSMVVPTSMSVSDAFGDLDIPVRDVPLPSLDAFGTTTTTTSENGGIGMDTQEIIDDDDDDFGTFETAAASTEANTTNSMGVQSNDDNVFAQPSLFTVSTATSKTTTIADIGTSLSITDAFSDMLIQQDAPLPSLTPTNPTGVVMDDEEDDFGGFEEAEVSAEPNTTFDVGSTERVFQPEGDNVGSDGDEDDDEFGDFGGASEDPPEADLLGFDALAIPRPPAMTDIGRTASEPIQGTFGMNSNIGSQGHVRSVSIDDAFGDFSIPQDAPLPSLEMLAATTTLSLEQVPVNSNDLVSSGGDDDDDFGDFEGEMQAPIDPPTSADNDDDDDDEFGDFGAASAEIDTTDPHQTDPFGSDGASDDQQKIPVQYETAGSAAPSLSITDPFDTMPTNYAPLPSLDMMDAPSTIPVQSDGLAKTFEEINNAGNDDEDDDFGGFETAPNVPATNNVENASDPFVPSELGSESLDATFKTTNDVDHFGSEIDPVSSGSSNPAVTDMGPMLSISDAFGDLEVADAPLPALMRTGSFPQDSSEDKNTLGNLTSNAPTSILDLYGVPPAETMVTTDGGDLLDFSGAEQQVVSGEVQSQVETDEFGDFGVAAPIEQDKCEEEDDFGAFGGAQPINSKEQLVNDTLSTGVDDFGVFGSAGMVAPSNQGVQQDDFGDFGGANVESTDGNEFHVFGSADATNPPEKDAREEDDFGDFGGAAVNVNVESTGGDDFGAFGTTYVKPISEKDTQEVDDFGDFGSAANNVESTAVDDFGIFGSADVQTPSMQGVDDMQTREEDDFGDFGSAEMTPPSVLLATNIENMTEDDFGVFASADGTAPSKQSAPTEEEDDFGGLGGTLVNSIQSTSPDITATSQKNDFGDFGSARVTSSVVSESYDNGQSVGANDFGDFGSAEVTAPLKHDIQPEREDDFGDFGSAGFPTSPEQNPSSSRPEDFGAPVEQRVDGVHPPVAEEDFGDFGSAEFVSPGESDDKLTSDEDFEEFGDFTVVEAPENSPSESEAGFGDFSTFQDASYNDTSQPEQARQSSLANNDMKNDDWGDFENVSAPSVESTSSVAEEIKIRDRIRSLALQLPQSVLRKSGVSGDHVDLGEAFEVNVGIKSSMTGSNRRRAYRCIRVLESLTSKDNSKLASTFWVQIFDVVNEELEQAKILLTEAESFSSNEWSEIKAPLYVMIQGIAEYMRVTRSILASIGDLLLLDESAILTVDTWVSTWCSLSILEKALESETKWKDIQKQLTNTPMPVVTLSTIQEIRSDATRSQVGSVDTLCHLTFQPLRKKDKSTTKEEVSFQGKQFMACSANFLANRCPFFVVGKEM